MCAVPRTAGLSRHIDGRQVAVKIQYPGESKEELLNAGIDRQLDRRRAMRDIRSLFAGLDDMRAELTVLGR
jgi:hypothetical protein